MTLPTQIVDIPFSDGLAQQYQQEVAPLGTFTSLANLQQIKQGAWQKRPGYSALATSLFLGGSITAGLRIFGYRDELCVVDGTQLLTRSPKANAFVSAGDPHSASLQGRIPGEALATSAPIAPIGSSCAQYDVAYANGYMLEVWTLPLGATAAVTILASVIDMANGAVVVSPTVIAGGAGTDLTIAVSVAALGARLVVFYALRNTALIVSQYIDTTSASTLASGFQGSGNAAADAFSSAVLPPNFDVLGLSDRIAVIYTNSGGVNSVTIKTFNFVGSTLTQIARVDQAGAVVPIGLALGGIQTDTLWAAWQIDATQNVQVIGKDPVTLLTSAVAAICIVTTAAGPVRLGVVRTGTQTGYVTADDGSSNHHTRPFNVAAGNVVPLSGTSVRFNMTSASRPFVVNSRVYQMVRPSVSANINQQHICVDLMGDAASVLAVTGPYLRPVASVTPRLAIAPSRLINVPPHVATVGNKVYTGSLTARTGTSASVDLVTLDFAAANRWQPALFGELACMSGGVPSYYDGVRTSEQGFLLSPGIVTGTGFGTGITSVTGFLYVAVYEQFDARGQRHQSAPSAPSAPVIVANKTVALLTTSLQITGRVSGGNVGVGPVRVVFYRTTDGGTVYYRLPGSETVNDSSVATVGFADVTSDTTLVTQPPLYTQPGTLGTAQPRVSPPSFIAHAAHGDRLVGIEGSNVWVSGQQVYGEGLWWSDAFVYPQTGGGLSAVWSMDGRIIAFGRSRIIYGDGAGPPDNGIGGDYTWQGIATPVGCIEPRSLVTIPAGTMFQSLRGIELLTRGMQIADGTFGNEIEDTLLAYPVITSAVNQEATGRVLFTCLASEGSASGSWIEYDYLRDIWTTGPRGTGAVSASAIGNQVGTVPTYAWVTAAGAVYQETPGAFLDNGTWIASSFEGPWISTCGVTGFQQAVRATLQAKAITPHDMTLSVAYDYSSSYTDVGTWTWATINAFTTARETLQMQFTLPECTSFRLKVTDSTPSSGVVGTGQGAILFGLQAEVGPNGTDFAPLPAENRK